MKRINGLTLGAVLAIASTPGLAADGDIDFSLLSQNVTDQAAADALKQTVQDIYDLAVEDLGSALSYKAVTPAEPLGITGFDVGLVITATSMANAKEWDEFVEGGSAISTLPTFKLAAHKGLPMGIDVGAFYMGTSGSNVKLVGAELRYAILEGGTATPALGVRGSYSKLSGISDFDFSTQGLELSVSKGILNFTPYAGVGMVSVSGDYSGNLGTTTFPVYLDKYSDTLTKYFVGVNVNMGLLNIVLDGDQTGESTSYSLKLGFRF